MNLWQIRCLAIKQRESQVSTLAYNPLLCLLPQDCLPLLAKKTQKFHRVPTFFLTSESEATHCHRNRIAVRTMARSNEPKFTHSSCLSVSTVCNNAISKASSSVCSLGVTKCSASRRSGDCLDSHNQECRMLKMLDNRAWAGRPTITKQTFKIGNTKN